MNNGSWIIRGLFANGERGLRGIWLSSDGTHSSQRKNDSTKTLLTSLRISEASSATHAVVTMLISYNK